MICTQKLVADFIVPSALRDWTRFVLDDDDDAMLPLKCKRKWLEWYLKALSNAVLAVTLAHQQPEDLDESQRNRLKRDL